MKISEDIALFERIAELAKLFLVWLCTILHFWQTYYQNVIISAILVRKIHVVVLVIDHQSSINDGLMIVDPGNLTA